MKFLADMGVSITAVQALRTAAHDAAHLREEGLLAFPSRYCRQSRPGAKGRAHIRSGFRRHSGRGANNPPSIIIFRPFIHS